MDIKRADLSAYILKFLPPTIQDGVLRDTAFCESVEFKPSFVTTVADDLSIKRPSLLRALRLAINGEKSANLLTDAGALKAKLRRASDGGVSIVAGTARLKFDSADPLLKDKKGRLAAVERLLARGPLSEAEERYWRAKALRPLSDIDFTEFSTAIGETPERFLARLEKPQNVSLSDLIPSRPEYYERLVGKWCGEETLQAYIDGALREYRVWLLSNHRQLGLRRIAYSALTAALVPLDILGDVSEAELAELIDVNDPYSLIFAVKVAQSRASADPAFVALGFKALEKLFGGESSVKGRCTVFSAAAVATLARLRGVFDDGKIPLYWFRLAALSHAGAIAEAFGTIGDGSFFQEWINQLAGPEFVWHTAVDRRIAPRWEANWIAPEQIYAELVGQACGAVTVNGEQKTPADWQDFLKAQVDQVIEGFRNHPFFPGPMDDFSELTEAPKAEAFVKVEESLNYAQTVDDTVGLVGLSYLAMPSESVAVNVIRIVEGLRAPFTVCTERVERFLDIAARIAVNSRSIALSESVVDVCVRFAAAEAVDAKLVSNLLQSALVACGAHRDVTQHRLHVGKAATRFSYATGDRFTQQLRSVFQSLARRDPKLSASLGRAQTILETVGLRARA